MTDNTIFTKRDFLTRIGMVAGTSAMMATMTAPPKMTADGNGKKVLILGAGISGLVCAMELI